MRQNYSKLLRRPLSFLQCMGIAQKMGLAFLALFLVAVTNVVLVERMMTRADQIADTVNVAGKLRMLGMRIALQTVSYEQGVGSDAAEIADLIADFDGALGALANGGYVFGLHLEGLSEAQALRLAAVSGEWAAYKDAVGQFLQESERLTEGERYSAVGISPSRIARREHEQQIAAHAAALLARTEALMNSILREVQSSQAATLNRLYGLIALDAVFILLAFIAVRRQIVRPLKDLSLHCKELAEGNYNTRSAVRSRDEIGQLAHVFNESAYRIGTLIQQISHDRHDRRRAEAMFQGIAENSMVGVYIALKGRFLYVNAKMAELFGYTRKEMVEDVPLTSVFPDANHSDEGTARQRLGGETPGLWMEKQGRRKDGGVVDVEIFGSLMLLDDQPVTIGVALDITRRKESEAHARLAMLVFRHSSEAIVVTDPDGRLISANPAFTRITGYEPGEVIGKKLSILSSGRHDAEFYKRMWQSIQTAGSWEGDIWNRRKNGEVYAEKLIVNTYYDEAGSPCYRIGLFSDITQQKEASALIWKQANYDDLTGLPNRQLFHSRLEQAMLRCDAGNKSMALVYLDIDDFKEVNDTLGHGFGDRMLEEVGKRLIGCARSTDTVARLGGDEFMFILSDFLDANAVEGICSKIMRSLREAFEIDGERATISASMGVTFYPGDGRTAKELMQNADLAMYAAKERGKHQMACFEPYMQTRAITRRELSRDLAEALENGELKLAYQPIVDMQSGKINKVECLLRWDHPERGAISPAVFVPFAEDSGLINSIGEWVFRKATRQIARWRDIQPKLQASINVSPVQFTGTHMSTQTWLEHLTDIGMDGEQIVVEITERLLMEADPEVSQKLIDFRDAGVQIALDDFGTGYSSMSYLKRFDIDYIKIDQSFVRNLGRHEDALVLCEAMIGMAHHLGLQVVAEGVETPLQRDLLKSAGCDFAQGYLFSPPISAAGFEALLRNGKMATAISNTHHSNAGLFAQPT